MQIPTVARYGAATVPPLLLLFLASTVWGGFAWIALAWLTIVAAAADHLLQPPAASAPEEDFAFWSSSLSAGLAIGHVLVLLSTTAAIASFQLTFGQGIALLLATASFFGQVSHPNAHDLIHRASPALRTLGALVYVSIGFGHHVSAHRYVHHRYVGSDQDPSTPRPGESFWSYLPRAWRGSFEAGLMAEIDHLERKGLAPTHPTNPYWLWTVGAGFALIAVIANAGPIAGLAAIIIGILACTQILMSDYVQHYGLQRLIQPDGRLEPVGPQHSWNAPRAFSSYLMMNATAHSEHHLHPDRPYDRLSPQSNVPTLPYAMPVMAMIALYPDVWRGMMDRRAVAVMEAAQTGAYALAPASASPEQAPAPVSEAEIPAPPAARGALASEPAEPQPSASPARPNAAAPQVAAAPQPEPVPAPAEDEDPETASLRAQIREATR